MIGLVATSTLWFAQENTNDQPLNGSETKRVPLIPTCDRRIINVAPRLQNTSDHHTVSDHGLTSFVRTYTPFILAKEPNPSACKSENPGLERRLPANRVGLCPGYVYRTDGEGH